MITTPVIYMKSLKKFTSFWLSFHYIIEELNNDEDSKWGIKMSRKMPHDKQCCDRK